MKLEISKAWCLAMAKIEADEIGAGRVALDPTTDASQNTDQIERLERNIGFSRFVQLMRRSKGLTVEKLAEMADISTVELVEIESGGKDQPELRTVYQLANYFKVPRANLLHVAGLTSSRNSRLEAETVRFAARSENTSVLTKEEQAALRAFVQVLSSKP